MSATSDAPKAQPLSLSRRFAWASAARLVLLSGLLLVVVFFSVREPDIASYSVQVVMWTLAAAFALSGVYAWFLRAGRYLRALVTIQLVLDQVIWTVVVYLSGGVSSGATSFYGLSCLFGALLGGYRGALIAGGAAAVCYATLVVLLSNDWLMVPPDQPVSAYSLTVREIAYSSVANLLMLVTVVLLAGSLVDRLRATGGQLLRAQARAEQAEREATLGRLAAGLAHEIRNPLGAISGSVSLLGANPTLQEEDRELCDIIQREANRLNDLVSDMLNLANPRKPDPVAMDVALVAREVVQLARHSGRAVSDVEIEVSGESSALTHADEAMVRQMLWNLVRNAVQASSPQKRVRVVVEYRGADLVVSVVDQGVGLSSEAKERIFDPFYTTRSQGTGVGLTVVRRIVDLHGFTIDVLDTPGGGATFRVNLGPPEALRPKDPPKVERWTLFPKAKA